MIYLATGRNGNPGSRQEWRLTEQAFAKLLAQLDPDKDRAGERYETLRLTFVKFLRFAGAHIPEECADETLNRIASKIDSGEIIRAVATYCRGVKRLILFET